MSNFLRSFRIKSYVLGFALLLLTSFILIGCKDQSNLLTDSQTELASVDEDIVILKTKDGDGSLITRVVIPEYWDGISTLKAGVVYKFRNEEEKLAAFATVPVVLDMYLKLKELRSAEETGNGKFKSVAALAATGSAYADVHESTRRNVLKVNINTLNSQFTPNDVMHHFLDWEWSSIHNYWIDGLSHYTEIEQERGCPEDTTTASGIVQLNCCDVLASDSDSDFCD